MKEIRLFFVPFLLFILPSPILSAQGIKTYCGLYNYGQATYSYYEDSSGVRVFHGPFSYERNEPKYLFRADGSYKNNLKDGVWKYEVEMRERSSRGDANWQPVARVLLIVGFKEGKRDGIFHYNMDEEGGKRVTYKLRMKNNCVVAIDELSEVEDGVTKKLRGWSQVGQFTEEGLPNGTWAKEYQSRGNLYWDIEEYAEGKLVKKQTKNISTGEIKDETSYYQERYAEDYYLPSTAFPRVQLPYFGRDLFPRPTMNTYDALEKGEKAYQGVPAISPALIAVKEREAEEARKRNEEAHIYEYLEESPEFLGGHEAMMEWLQSNINYPQSQLRIIYKVG